ncbi:Endonuclease III [Vibrio hippocampi]|uniref:Endonuclease III n=1 Tax=Vibrio hippocampi TaxID=654686 RepID=A0ABM8ZH26_9VIBR|nr:endonuclease [Vibrio hippocampi]CAH0525853.1 Endonuclease III [Vibrio hippocampi]
MSHHQAAVLIQRTFERLESHYGLYQWWPETDPYQVILGAILVQNTNWRNAEKALETLGHDANPLYIERIDINTLAQAIRSSGYYNQKAKKLKAVTQWFANYQYQIERVRDQSFTHLRNELLTIKGVGGETADVILTYAIGKPSFVIDAYARRLLSRVGLDVPKSYEAFRSLMQSALQGNEVKYGYYHGVIVDHGQQFCRKTPECSDCPLSHFCRKVGV